MKSQYINDALDNIIKDVQGKLKAGGLFQKIKDASIKNAIKQIQNGLRQAKQIIENKQKDNNKNIANKEEQINKLKKQLKVRQQNLNKYINLNQTLVVQNKILKKSIQQAKNKDDVQKIVIQKQKQMTKQQLCKYNKQIQILKQKAQQLHLFIKQTHKMQLQRKQIQTSLQQQKKKLQNIIIKKNQEAVKLKQIQLIYLQLSEKVSVIRQASKISQYNIVVKLNNINQFLTGVQIQSNQNINQLNIQKIVGLIGGQNYGKTFLLNKITGYNFVSGYQNRTIGISIKTPCQQRQQLKNALFMDTCGYSKAAQFSQRIRLTEKQIQNLMLKEIQQLRHAQKLIQQYVLKHSKIIIIVVNQLNLEDQRRLASIIFNNSKQYNDRIFCIVHNFKHIIDHQTLNKRIKTDIIQGCLAKQQQSIIQNIYQSNKSSQLRYYVTQTKAGFHLYHYVLVNQNSELGKQINWKTYQTLKNQIRNPLANKLFKIKQSFINFSKLFIKSCYQYSQTLNLNLQETKIKEKLIQKIIIDQKTIDLQKFALKKNMYNVLGKKIQNNLYYNIIRNSKQKKCQIYFDLPGDIKNIGFQLLPNKFKLFNYQILIKYTRNWQQAFKLDSVISGNRDIDPQRQQKLQIIFDAQQLKIQLDVDQIRKSKDSLIKSIGNGIFLIQLPEMASPDNFSDQQYQYS